MNKEIKLAKETQSLIKKIVKKWGDIRADFTIDSKKDSYSSGRETKIGRIWWDNPNLVWIFATSRDEGYEGSQSQVGLAKDGTLRWEYQSHCSCDDYEDSADLPDQFTQDTLKSFDFTYTQPPLDWEEKMRENMGKLLKPKTINLE